MPTAEEMRAAMKQYLAHVAERDVEAVLGLFTDDISVEDPVGGAPGTHVVGREEVGAFFRKGFARSKPTPVLSGPIHTTLANEAAMAFTLQLELGDKHCEVDVIDVVTFDESGRIARLRAFWNPEEIRSRA